jgi:hypothetical protein
VNYFSSIAFDWSGLISLVHIEVFHNILRILVHHLRISRWLGPFPLSDLFAHEYLLETWSVVVYLRPYLLGCERNLLLFLKSQK